MGINNYIIVEMGLIVHFGELVNRLSFIKMNRFIELVRLNGISYSIHIVYFIQSYIIRNNQVLLTSDIVVLYGSFTETVVKYVLSFLFPYFFPQRVSKNMKKIVDEINDLIICNFEFVYNRCHFQNNIRKLYIILILKFYAKTQVFQYKKKIFQLLFNDCTTNQYHIL